MIESHNEKKWEFVERWPVAGREKIRASNRGLGWYRQTADQYWLILTRPGATLEDISPERKFVRAGGCNVLRIQPVNRSQALLNEILVEPDPGLEKEKSEDNADCEAEHERRYKTDPVGHADLAPP